MFLKSMTVEELRAELAAARKKFEDGTHNTIKRIVDELKKRK